MFFDEISSLYLVHFKILPDKLLTDFAVYIFVYFILQKQVADFFDFELYFDQSGEISNFASGNPDLISHFITLISHAQKQVSLTAWLDAHLWSSALFTHSS